MIVLDTNVLSALMRPSPDAAVMRWLDSQPTDSLWLTTITLFELRLGIALLPKGRRRTQIEIAFERVVSEDLANRVVMLDEEAAEKAAALAAERQRAGRPVELRDTLIAGIAQAHRATIATGNTKHFQGLDVPVVDPWHP